ncbi:MAG: C40 family peptidase [Kiloniellales bacterium]
MGRSLSVGPPIWTEGYIGIPYADKGHSRDGVDCWGLVRLVYAEQLGVDLPSYADRYASAADLDEVARLIDGERGPWRTVKRPRALDVLLLRIRGAAGHVALVAAPGWMLHVMDQIEVALERYETITWARRIAGAYRHEALNHAA